MGERLCVCVRNRGGGEKVLGRKRECVRERGRV